VPHLYLWEEIMNNEEYTAAQQVIAEGNTSLAFQALQEANDELQSKLDSYIEDLNRLRTTNRTLRTVNKTLRAQVENLLEAVEQRDEHIFDIAAKEFVAEGNEEILDSTQCSH
jgi:predicted transcriptional regulator